QTPACTTITVSGGTADFQGVGQAPPPATPTNPPSGSPPLDVQFTDLSTGGPVTWAWDFDNDGTVDDTTANPMHTYTAQGSYSVKLTVTYPSGPPVTVVKTGYVKVGPPKCTVPDFSGQSTNAAPGLWSGAGFTGAIAYKQGGLPWIVQ